MTAGSDERPVNLKAFEKLPPGEPVVMINLLKFKEAGGRERYLQYGREVQPHLDRVGGAVRYAGTNPANIIGDGETPWWDAILVVELLPQKIDLRLRKLLQSRQRKEPNRWRYG